MYLHADAASGSGVLDGDILPSIFSCAVIYEVNRRAGSAKSVLPNFPSTHCIPGLEQIDRYDLGPAGLPSATR